MVVRGPRTLAVFHGTRLAMRRIMVLVVLVLDDHGAVSATSAVSPSLSKGATCTVVGPGHCATTSGARRCSPRTPSLGLVVTPIQATATSAPRPGIDGLFSGGR